MGKDAYDTQRVSFTNREGDRLDARLEMPHARPRAFALFAHCFTCSKNAAAATWVSRALTEEGIAVLRFDFTGLGSSEGDFANSGFSSNVDDLVSAAAYLREEHAAPSLLVGHSLGGAACLVAARHVEEVRAVATIGAPAEPAHVLRLVSDRERERIETEGRAEIDVAGRSFPIAKQFLDDLETHDVAGGLGALDQALLVCHAPGDTVVGIDNARRLFEAARHPKSFLSLDHADHLLSRREDARWLARTLAAWASRYVDLESEAPAEGEEPEEGFVVVQEVGRYTQRVRAGRHELVADEPESVGGADRGPTPYDLLLAALGTCTSMTLRMYADRKEWPLERVVVRLRHDKIHAKDCRECESKTGKVDHIERRVQVDGDLDDEQRARLLEIADRCPVHRTLMGEKVIQTGRD